MNVAGEGDTAYAASEGAQPKGNLNVDAVPEAPVTRTAPRPAPAPAARPPQRPAPPAPPRPGRGPAPAAAGGATIQLGAFSSQAGATRAWSGLAGRFRYLAPLAPQRRPGPGRRPHPLSPPRQRRRRRRRLPPPPRRRRGMLGRRLIGSKWYFDPG